MYAGIDPGRKGSLVLLNDDGEVSLKLPTPCLATKEYDIIQMGDILSSYNIKHCVLENVHAFQGGGATSNFEFGMGYGIWITLLTTLKIPYTRVNPKAWQKEAWQGVTEQKVPTTRKNKAGETIYKTDTKATSLLAAKRLYPTLDLRATERSKVPHEGIVDALLMARYCRQKFR